MNELGTYIILRKDEKTLSLLFQKNRLVYAGAESEDEGRIGNIYIGKIKNIVQNIKAAFVEIAPGENCFLPLSELKHSSGKKLAAGDEITVQVIKDAVKTKQAVLTTRLSINGKYAVVTLGSPGISYSSKLSLRCRKRMQGALSLQPQIHTEDFGFVVRTNAGELEEYSALIDEMIYLQDLISKIKKIDGTRICYSLIYQSMPEYLVKLRDLPKDCIDQIVTDNQDIYDQIIAFQERQPESFPIKVRLYEDSLLPLHKLYAVETRLKEALLKKVWLKSGGYLVIEPTEALTVIDVNTGKVTGKKTTEETFFLMNMEAAVEIALQTSLRGLSGIIIVDFINMKNQEHQLKLLETFRDLIKKDPVKTSVPQMTTLGLVEFTRMKINRPLAEQMRQETNEL